MLRRKFPLASVMLSAWSANNDCKPGEASEAYILRWRDRKQRVRTAGEGGPLFLRMQTVNCFGKRRREEQRCSSLLFSWLQSSSHSLLREHKSNVTGNHGKQLRDTQKNSLCWPLRSTSSLCRPQCTCCEVWVELCTHSPIPQKDLEFLTPSTSEYELIWK